MDAAGIQRQLTAARTPHQNGVAERKNRTLIECVRSLAIDMDIPASFWDELVLTANYILNRCSTRALKESTPHEHLLGRKPNLSYFRVVGCVAYVHIAKELRTKLGVKALKTVFLGYDNLTKGFRCFDPTRNKIIISRDVRFDESQKGDFRNSSSPLLTHGFFSDLFPSPELQALTPGQHTPSGDSPDNILRFPETSPSPSPGVSPSTQTTSTHGSPSPPRAEPLAIEPFVPRRSVRMREAPLKYVKDHHAYSADFKYTGEDSTCTLITLDGATESIALSKAVKDSRWLTAIQEELAALGKNRIWDLVPLPPGKKPLSSKWVLKVKPDPGPTLTRLKARLVAKGYEQREGIDYHETFAPVVKWSTIRAIIALAASLNWTISHMDVVTAFLNGLLDETIFMLQPPGFSLPGLEHLVCLLKRTLYGLKQSPRAWYQAIDSFLLSSGWQRSTQDHNLYFFTSGSILVIILLFVDDLLITGNSNAKIDETKKQLKQQYEMKELGPVTRYLGVQIDTLPDGYFLHQQNYTDQLLLDAGMTECRPSAVPLPEGTVLFTDMSAAPVDSTHYSRLVGKLIYLTNTRPDISYFVGIVNRYMVAPQQPHLDAVRHILRYLRATSDFGLLYSRTSPSQLQGFTSSNGPWSITGFTDADWGACQETRRSVGAYLFLFAGGPISWSSKRQLTVSRSSTESEYKSLSNGAQESVHLSRLLNELPLTTDMLVPLHCSEQSVLTDLTAASLPTQHDILLHCDNIGALKLAKNPVFHARTKHIEIDHHFVRERVLEGEICLSYISTHDQPADLLTKPLGRLKFNQHRHAIGMVSRKSLNIQE